MRIGIIGGGPAGYIAALRAAQFGSQVILIEKQELGGTCLNVGCIPTKSLLENSAQWNEVQHNILFEGMDKNFFYSPPWEQLFRVKNHTVTQLRQGIKYLLKKAGVQVLNGIGRLVNRQQIEISNDNEVTQIDVDVIILATGSYPNNPPIPGVKGNKNIMTSDELLRLDQPIESLAIIGGGVIGLEFATIYQGMGVSTTIIEVESEIVSFMDGDVSHVLRQELEKKGIQIKTSSKVSSIEQVNENEQVIQLQNGEKVTSSHVLLATGRLPNTKGLGLEEAGVVLDRGKIVVNASYQTSLNNIYAVGDCSSSMMLAHVASKEAVLAVEHAHTGIAKPLHYSYVPQVIYTYPEASSLGLTKPMAEQLGYTVKESVFPLNANGRALIHKGDSGFVKIVSEQKYGQVLGFHMIGPYASELVNQVSLALHLECTVDELADMIHAHPTVSESLGEVALMAKGLGLHV